MYVELFFNFDVICGMNELFKKVGVIVIVFIFKINNVVLVFVDLINIGG